MTLPLNPLMQNNNDAGPDDPQAALFQAITGLAQAQRRAKKVARKPMQEKRLQARRNKNKQAKKSRQTNRNK